VIEEIPSGGAGLRKGFLRQEGQEVYRISSDTLLNADADVYRVRGEAQVGSLPWKVLDFAAPKGSMCTCVDLDTIVGTSHVVYRATVESMGTMAFQDGNRIRETHRSKLTLCSLIEGLYETSLSIELWA
jgi:hypothetical protein